MINERKRLGSMYEKLPHQVKESLIHSGLNNYPIEEALRALRYLDDTNATQWLDHFDNILSIIDLHTTKEYQHHVSMNTFLKEKSPDDEKYGGTPTLMRTLDHGQSFYVRNGAWSGTIKVVNGIKMIHVHDTDDMFPAKDTIYYI